MKLYNTRSKCKVEIQKKRELKLYCCGPTVYAYAHIGNLRTYICEDFLLKTFKCLDYKLNHVMNITDIGHLTGDSDLGEDKVLKTAREKRLSVLEVSKFYTEEFFKSCELLNIQRPNKILVATDYVPQMINIIEKLEKLGFTYFANGNVYFDTAKYKDYGKMASIVCLNLFDGSRVELDYTKKNKADFVLWFTRSKFSDQAMKWESPWGFGYPSWHIECSAMNLDYFGSSLDIHCGGVDHIGVHHTNELAICESFLGIPWCNLWVHFEFLILDVEKMSKSKGNSITLNVLKEKEFSPLDFRYLCLTTHYRTQLKFTFVSLQASRNARLKLVDRVSSLYLKLTKEELEQLKLNFVGELEKQYYSQFLEKISNDLNIPQALALAWELLKEVNLKELEKVKLLFAFDEIFSINLKQLVEVKEDNEIIELDEDLTLLLKERLIARKNKNYVKSDEIRRYFEQKGFVLVDLEDDIKVKKG